MIPSKEYFSGISPLINIFNFIHKITTIHNYQLIYMCVNYFQFLFTADHKALSSYSLLYSQSLVHSLENAMIFSTIYLVNKPLIQLCSYYYLQCLQHRARNQVTFSVECALEICPTGSSLQSPGGFPGFPSYSLLIFENQF